MKRLETLASDHEALPLKEVIEVKLIRADGTEEIAESVDLIVNTGRIYIAKRISGGDTVASAMAYMAVGTATTAPALTDTTLPGEVKRKGLAVASATNNNVWTAVATFGGAADGVTGVAIAEAGVFNHQDSGQGTMMQRVTFSAVTLQDSDLLKITLQTNVGSNTI